MEFTFFILFLFPFLTACSMDVSISDAISKAKSPSSAPAFVIDDSSPGVIAGEKVKTTLGTPGYVLSVSLFESDSTQTTSSGYKLEGVINETTQ